VAHKVYGVASAINCANYVYFVALQQCASMNNPKASAMFLGRRRCTTTRINYSVRPIGSWWCHKWLTLVFVAAEEMINLHHGQGFDIFWRDHQICPTEEEYKKMVLDSTRTRFSPCSPGTTHAPTRTSSLR